MDGMEVKWAGNTEVQLRDVNGRGGYILTQELNNSIDRNDRNDRNDRIKHQ